MEHKQDINIRFSPVIWFPAEVTEAWNQKNKRDKDAAFIAGGTLIQMQREQGTPCSSHLISLENITELYGMSTVDSYLRIGSLTTLAECLQNDELKHRAALFYEAIQNIAAPAVRNRGTVGGNLMYGKGDTIPALLVMNALVSYFDGTKTQLERISDFLERDVGKDGILLTSIWIPENKEQTKSISFYKKIGRREAFSSSILTAAGMADLDEEGNWTEVRLAVGGGDIPPQRLTQSESQVIESVSIKNELRNVYNVIRSEMISVTDAFASAAYRKTVAANIILSHLYEGSKTDDERKGR
ncbi:xanthine dehydrogenase [Salibacterium salarium]|uniref:Xanthine dehydrogenase n=1 Tax=Salibacterium salarium TaxID=284579 RepID=A0A428N222_9BACI|nr:FAD binding domain-containing protein [Salibacterium salarium]RSL32396.1 xanthine dehydrogenase [Salibacterium salarium]